jgi:hypothetical protein
MGRWTTSRSWSPRRAETKPRSAVWWRRTEVSRTHTATGCSARSRAPRTRCRTPCSVHGKDFRASEAAARCAHGSTESPPTPVCASSNAAPNGCWRPTSDRPGKARRTWASRSRSRPSSSPTRTIRSPRTSAGESVERRLHRSAPTPARDPTRSAGPPRSAGVLGSRGRGTVGHDGRIGEQRAATSPQDPGPAPAGAKPGGDTPSTGRGRPQGTGDRLRAGVGRHGRPSDARPCWWRMSDSPCRRYPPGTEAVRTWAVSSLSGYPKRHGDSSR